MRWRCNLGGGRLEHRLVNKVKVGIIKELRKKCYTFAAVQKMGGGRVRIQDIKHGRGVVA